MKPPPVEYASPERLAEVIAILAEHGEEAKLLAGGQSLVPLLAMRLAAPSLLVDLNRVGELEYIRQEANALVLGALARHRDVEELAGLRERCPILWEAVASIGHVAIRNRGTVGGSLAHADPAAEWPAVALALDAEVHAAGPSGVRTIAARDLFVSPFTTSLAPTEVLTEVRLCLPDGAAGSAFVEFARRPGDFALAGAGAVLWTGPDGRVRDARVALVGVAGTAVRSDRAEALLRDNEPTDEVLAEAAAAVDGDIDPVSDVHASSEFRRHLARVMTRRALARARDRVTGGKRVG